MEQEILESVNDYEALDIYLEAHGAKHIFLVCGKSFDQMKLKAHLDKLCQREMHITRFSDFKPNPAYESVAAGVKAFRESGADVIMAVGGGSAMDVAKCIKLYRGKLPNEEHPEDNCGFQEILLIAVPTTAGTGSEATRYAVIYRDGEKQSVTDDSIIPDAVLYDPELLSSLPRYHRESAMLDALCHGIESFWSVNSTEESRIISEKAIMGVLTNWNSFLANESAGNAGMLKAAYWAGKAINITQTTAGHAMSYKLTSIYGISHGHAVALCVSVLWPWMLAHLDDCIDTRGQGYLKQNFQALAELFGGERAEDGGIAFQERLGSLQLKNFDMLIEDIPLLADTVNSARLKNHPVNLTSEEIEELYANIRRRCMTANEG